MIKTGKKCTRLRDPFLKCLILFHSGGLFGHIIADNGCDGYLIRSKAIRFQGPREGNWRIFRLERPHGVKLRLYFFKMSHMESISCLARGKRSIYNIAYGGEDLYASAVRPAAYLSVYRRFFRLAGIDASAEGTYIRQRAGILLRTLAANMGAGRQARISSILHGRNHASAYPGTGNHTICLKDFDVPSYKYRLKGSKTNA